MDYPAEIERTMVDLAHLARETSDIRGEMREIEIEQLSHVLSACDPETQKPLFTNDKQRDHALAVRLTEQAQYASLKASLAGKELEKGIMTAKLERLRGEFKEHLLDRQMQVAGVINSGLAV